MRSVTTALLNSAANTGVFLDALRVTMARYFGGARTTEHSFRHGVPVWFADKPAYLPRRLSIASIWSMMLFMRAASAWYGCGVARSTPAAFTSAYGSAELPEDSIFR